MEELNSFFNFAGETSKTVALDGSETKGQLPLTEEDLEDLKESDRVPYKILIAPGVDYPEYYRELDRLEQERQCTYEANDSKPIESCDDVTSMGDMTLAVELVEDNFFYDKHIFKDKPNSQLTINSEKQNILNTVANDVITIIQGPTGCGKTTQVPQWILEEHYDNRKYCNIVVTQPRRIAAISIAKRVCEENDFDLGGIVGYQVGLDAKISNETRLQYVTTGVLLQKLVTTKTLDKYTHIILDEVHERNQDMDFLFIVVKKLLRVSKGVKIILMSATFNTEKFGAYFSSDYESLAPTIIIDSKTNYKVNTFYLESLSTLGKYPEIQHNEPKISKDMYIYTLKTINAFEDIDVVEEVPYTRPSVLVFLPGIYEIEQLYNMLNDHELRSSVDKDKAKMKWWLIPLHSTITTEEQVRVFRQPPPDHRKIILATNIAESSITVPDIKYVIDFCLSKILTSNKETNFSSLQLAWASKANCKQRAGRTGRVRDGRVYRMVPESFYHSLPEDCMPEIQRCPLDNLVLSTKLLDMGPPASILALAMDPPDLTDICQTVQNLKQIGALLRTANNIICLDDGDITFIGRIMAKLPLDTRIAKLIVLGYVFGCIDECIIISGAMSVRNVFSTPFQERMTAYSTKLTWADGSSSDCIALLGVYKTYQHLCRQKYFATAHHGERGWSKRLYLQANALHEMDALVKELRHRLVNEDIMEGTKQNLWQEWELPLLLKVLIAGAFYPYYFSFKHGGERDEREASRTLGGRDPRNTVYFTNMEQRQPVQLYAASIKRALKDCSKEDFIVTSEAGGSKLYVTFPSQEGLVQGGQNNKCSLIPGKVALPVYKAVKMRQLRIPVTLNLLPLDKALEEANKLGIPPEKAFKEFDVSEQISPLNPRLPDIDENYIDILLTHVIDCGHFWSQYADERSQKRLRWAEYQLTNHTNLKPLEGPPKLNVMYAAPFQKSPMAPIAHYRAKVTNILQDGRVAILYIDYGNGALIKSNTLQEIVGEFAEGITSFSALAFECVLKEVSPSLVMDSRGLWTNAAIKAFTDLVCGKKVLGLVYSVAYCVVSLELLLDNFSVNKFLIDKGYASVSEESYASKENRAERDSAHTLQRSQKAALSKRQAMKQTEINTSAVMYPPPNPKDCTKTITLKGPFSPLETNVHSLMYAGKDKSVNVQWDSVNSVILNPDPQNPYERLLVASHIDQSSGGGHITLRNTTLLPNIPGLPALMALIFSPFAELQPDLTLTKYCAVLSGLGHVDGHPLYPAHDVLIHIDVDFDNEDLKQVNMLRFYMDTLLLTEGTQELPTSSETYRLAQRTKIKVALEKILLKKRKYREPGSLKKPWQWCMKYHDMEMETTNIFKDRAIYPPHDGLELQEVSYSTQMNLARANYKLYQMCNSVLLSGNNKAQCVLCHTDLLPVTSMRIHLNSRMHKEKEADLPEYCETGDELMA